MNSLLARLRSHGGCGDAGLQESNPPGRAAGGFYQQATSSFGEHRSGVRLPEL